jgi:hypothetical protein
MPFAFDLENLRTVHNCVHYFETGLWNAEEGVSSKQALAAGFKRVFCIELQDVWVRLGRKVFKEEISSGRYTLIHDDSTKMEQYLKDTCFQEKTMFFLDAHVDHSYIQNYTKICPLLDELKAIKSLPRNDNVILVDDLRLLKMEFPWGETSYGSINFVDEIKRLVLDINPDYKFTTLDGHIKDDVLMCYTEISVGASKTETIPQNE